MNSGYGILPDDSDSSFSTPSSPAEDFYNTLEPLPSSISISGSINFPLPANPLPLPIDPEDLAPLSIDTRNSATIADSMEGVFGVGAGLQLSKRKEVAWPQWNGKTETFDFYAFRMSVKLDGNAVLLGENRKLICMSMIDTLPENRQMRISHWFQEGGPNKDWDPVRFLAHFTEQFEDKQAQESAMEELTRMRQGTHQYFADYLQDFEYKLAQCQGMNWPSRVKIMNLNTGINAVLKDRLVTVTLSKENYNDWVLTVKIIAERLENLPSYRPKGATKTKTWFLNHPGTKTTYYQQPEHSVDADGDTSMGGINGIAAAVANLTTMLQASQSLGSKKPAAKWKDKATYQKCWDKNLCMRCEKKGHSSYDCPRFGPAKKPAKVLSTRVSREDSDSESYETGKE